MLIDYKRGQAGAIIRMKVRLESNAPATGLTHSTSGLAVSTIADNEATATAYTAGASNLETIATLGTYAAPTAGKARIREVDATNHPGVYEIHLANARLAVAGAKSLLVTVRGTGISAVDALVPLRDVDPYDAAAFGLSRLDAAVSSRATVAGMWGATHADYTTAGTVGASIWPFSGVVGTGSTTGTINLGNTQTRAAGRFVYLGVDYRVLGTHLGDGVYNVSPAWSTAPLANTPYVLGGPATIVDAAAIAAAVWANSVRTLSAGAITSATFAIGTVNAAATGLLERLTFMYFRFFPPAGGSVTMPRNRNGQLIMRGTGGAVLSQQAVTDDATTQTLGPPTLPPG